jgi:hypothetical protein
MQWADGFRVPRKFLQEMEAGGGRGVEWELSHHRGERHDDIP